MLTASIADTTESHLDEMVCPNCETFVPFPPTISDNETTTCPHCGHRFPISDRARRDEPAPVGMSS